MKFEKFAWLTADSDVFEVCEILKIIKPACFAIRSICCRNCNIKKPFTTQFSNSKWGLRCYKISQFIFKTTFAI